MLEFVFSFRRRKMWSLEIHWRREDFTSAPWEEVMVVLSVSGLDIFPKGCKGSCSPPNLPLPKDFTPPKPIETTNACDALLSFSNQRKSLSQVTNIQLKGRYSNRRLGIIWRWVSPSGKLMRSTTTTHNASTRTSADRKTFLWGYCLKIFCDWGHRVSLLCPHTNTVFRADNDKTTTRRRIGSQHGQYNQVINVEMMTPRLNSQYRMKRSPTQQIKWWNALSTEREFFATWYVAINSNCLALSGVRWKSAVWSHKAMIMRFNDWHDDRWSRM